MKTVSTIVLFGLVGLATANPNSVNRESYALQVGRGDLGFLHDVSSIGLSRITETTVGTTTKISPVTLELELSTADKTRGVTAVSWIAAFLAGTSAPTNARLTAYGTVDNRARISVGLVDFAITEVQLPVLDANTQKPGVARVEGTPKRIERQLPPSNPPTRESRVWLASNFRVTIDGLDSTRVVKVGAITVKRSGTRNVILPFSLDVTTDERTMIQWFEWGEKVLVANTPDKRNAKIELLGPDLREVFATVELTGVTVVAMSYLTTKSRTNELQLSAETIRLVSGKTPDMSTSRKVPLAKP
jgi:hypothetical protein